VAAVIAGFARRPRDLAARIGGEEFVLLLPGAGRKDAYRVAESLRRAVAVLDAGLDGPVTVSIGVSSQVPVGSVGSESLLQRADEALYRAKREGRNRVVLAD
jgi:diguanylate cyclase (GGDEF)-like protein